MNSLTQVDSVALFGSVPRGDADRHSDRDVLVVSLQPASQVESELTRAGFSPSFYSWQQLENLAADGSLFLQHLKQESRILLDRDGRLTDFLAAFQPRRDYSARIIENLQLFELTNGVPDVPTSVSWAFDVLAVALRNHAILLLAQTGRYIFSFAELVAQLKVMHGLSDFESSLLLELRTFKRKYRLHPHAVNVSLCRLQQTQAVIEKVTGADCLSLRQSPQEFGRRLLATSSQTDHWYCLLRRYEGVHRSNGFVPLSDASRELMELEHIFANPSPYRPTGSDAIRWVREKVQSLATN